METGITSGEKIAASIQGAIDTLTDCARDNTILQPTLERLRSAQSNTNLKVKIGLLLRVVDTLWPYLDLDTESDLDDFPAIREVWESASAALKECMRLSDTNQIEARLNQAAGWLTLIRASNPMLDPLIARLDYIIRNRQDPTRLGKLRKIKRALSCFRHASEVDEAYDAVCRAIRAIRPKRR
jgi:hypothetical protein